MGRGRRAARARAEFSPEQQQRYRELTDGIRRIRRQFEAVAKGEPNTGFRASFDNPSEKEMVTMDIMGQRLRELDKERRGMIGLNPDERTWQKGTPGLEEPDENGRFPETMAEGTPERQAYRNRVIEEFVSKGSTEPKGKDGKKLAIVMMGGPASGKSTIRRQMYGDEPGFVTMDADAVKEYLPEYRLGVANGDMYSAARVHEESSTVAKRIRDEAIRRGMNVIIDGTGGNLRGYSDMMNKLRAEGYEIRLIMPQVEVETGVARALKRSHSTGRFVPEHVIRGNYDRIPRNFAPLARLADEATMIDSASGQRIARFERQADGTVNENWTPGIGDQFKATYGV